MNELQIFSNEEFESIRILEKENKDKYTGFFYILEWNNMVKIGSTKNPYQRLLALKRTAENYGSDKLGRIALSVPHTNYRDNEKTLHKFFSNCRKPYTELFNMEFEDVISKIPANLEYADDSEKINERAEAIFAGLKNFVLGGNAIWMKFRFLTIQNLAL